MEAKWQVNTKTKDIKDRLGVKIRRKAVKEWKTGDINWKLQNY